jgi:transcriptional regulator with AAA-type ATPase domain
VCRGGGGGAHAVDVGADLDQHPDEVELPPLRHRVQDVLEVLRAVADDRRQV